MTIRVFATIAAVLALTGCSAPYDAAESASTAPPTSASASPGRSPSGTAEGTDPEPSTLRTSVGRCAEKRGVVIPPSSIEKVCWYGQAPTATAGTTIVIGHSTYSAASTGYLERWVPEQPDGSIVRFEGVSYRVDGPPFGATKGALPAWVFSAAGERAIAVVTCDQTSPHSVGSDGVQHARDNLILRLVPVG